MERLEFSCSLLSFQNRSQSQQTHPTWPKVTSICQRDIGRAITGRSATLGPLTRRRRSLPLLAPLFPPKQPLFYVFFLLILSNTRVCFLPRFHYQNITFSLSILCEFSALPLFLMKGYHEQTHTYPSVMLMLSASCPCWIYVVCLCLQTYFTVLTGQSLLCFEILSSGL